MRTVQHEYGRQASLSMMVNPPCLSPIQVRLLLLLMLFTAAHHPPPGYLGGGQFQHYFTKIGISCSARVFLLSTSVVD